MDHIDKNASAEEYYSKMSALLVTGKKINHSHRLHSLSKAFSEQLLSTRRPSITEWKYIRPKNNEERFLVTVKRINHSHRPHSHSKALTEHLIFITLSITTDGSRGKHIQPRNIGERLLVTVKTTKHSSHLHS